jgi:hypothetical protein
MDREQEKRRLKEDLKRFRALELAVTDRLASSAIRNMIKEAEQAVRDLEK